MASTYMPVETILKVDETEVLIGGNEKDEQNISDSSSLVSIGTQCDWKVESPDNSCDLLSVDEKRDSKITVSPDSLLIEDKNTDEMSMVFRGWPPNYDPNSTSDPKLLIPATFAPQFSCNIQTLPVDEKFFLQFDYRTRNKLKTKQRRLDPYYRSQERVRQRTVMRIKRQDPGFRAVEREKGRFRMRLKRLDPVFRSQEREKQRERMKMKRSDPEFREKEREQQKTRLHEKRLDPTFKEKERAQDRLRMHIKRQNNGLFSTINSDDIEPSPRNANITLVTESQAFRGITEPCSNPITFQSNQAVFPENLNARLLSIRPREPTFESFHFKKQHILNFNFYNSTKEQWAVRDELSPKNMPQFNLLGGMASANEDSVDILRRDYSETTKKTISKNDANSLILVNVKSDRMLPTETPKPDMSDHHCVSTKNGISSNRHCDISINNSHNDVSTNNSHHDSTNNNQHDVSTNNSHHGSTNNSQHDIPTNNINHDISAKIA